MIHMNNDYGKGTLPEILGKIGIENLLGHPGYGLDDITNNAEEGILRVCSISDGAVYFLAGGTQTNIVALDWLTRPGEGVLCTRDAHINVHEAGAIEMCGHKVIAIDNGSDLISAKDIIDYMEHFYTDATWPHMVIPGAVYISQPTELGSLYSLKELENLRSVCTKYELKLYVDGARMAYALGAPECDVSLADIARLSDGFYIGGTKCGTLFGEALVIPAMKSEYEKKRLFNHVKRHGALMAKGWLVALQFDEILKENRYQSQGARAVEMATYLREELFKLGISVWRKSPTNQQFFIVPEQILKKIDGKISYDVWGARGEQESIIRLVTDWSTTPADIQECLKCITSPASST